MRVHQIPVTRHPMLVALQGLLDACPRARDADVQRGGDLAADIAAGPPPENRQATTVRAYAPLQAIKTATMSLYPGLHLRGAFYYPPGGGQGWHTNSDAPGWRVYLVRAPEERSYLGTQEGIVLDRTGYANVFQLGPGSWHYVMAACERWSLGFMPSADVVRALAL